MARASGKVASYTTGSQNRSAIRLEGDERTVYELRDSDSDRRYIHDVILAAILRDCVLLVSHDDCVVEWARVCSRNCDD